MIHLFESTKNYFFFSVFDTSYTGNKEGSITFTTSETHDENNTKHLNILIIDDQEVCILAAEVCLIASPHNLIKATSGEAGLQYMKENPGKVDLVILDIMMPSMSGIEVLSIMKEDPKLKNIPVIMSTGSDLIDYRDEAFSLGAAFYLKKPYTKQELLSAIDEVIKFKLTKV